MLSISMVGLVFVGWLVTFKPCIPQILADILQRVQNIDDKCTYLFDLIH